MGERSTLGRAGRDVTGSETREIDDAALVRAVQAGNVGAYAVLYRRHEPAVRRLCTRWLHNDAAVDEVVQAAFVRAFEHIDRCNGESRFSGWVQVIAQRICIDTARAALRAEARAERAANAGPKTAEDPAETVMLHEQVDALQFAIAALPRRQREVVVARLVEGRRPSEIAATLGMSIAAVDSLLLRARRKLASAYGAVADERGGIDLSTASAVVVTAAVSAEPETSLRLLATAARVVSAPFAPMASAAPSVGRGLRVAAAAVAAALGGGLVGAAPPSRTHSAPPPAVASAPSGPGDGTAGLPGAPPAADPLDPAGLTITLPLTAGLPPLPPLPPVLPPASPPTAGPPAGPSTLLPGTPGPGSVAPAVPDDVRSVLRALPQPGRAPLLSALPEPLSATIAAAGRIADAVDTGGAGGQPAPTPTSGLRSSPA